MTAISESITVLCPFDQGRQAAAAYASTLPPERHVSLVVSQRELASGDTIMELEWRSPADGAGIVRGTVSIEDAGDNFCRLHFRGEDDRSAGATAAAARKVLDDIRVGFEFAFQTGATIP